MQVQAVPRDSPELELGSPRVSRSRPARGPLLTETWAVGVMLAINVTSPPAAAGVRGCPRSGPQPHRGSYAGQHAKESCLPSRDLYLGAASQLHVQAPIHSKVYAFDVFEIDDLLAVGTKEPLGIQTRFEA